jgi:hypothetical protein
MRIRGRMGHASNGGFLFSEMRRSFPQLTERLTVKTLAVRRNNIGAYTVGSFLVAPTGRGNWRAIDSRGTPLVVGGFRHVIQRAIRATRSAA